MMRPRVLEDTQISLAPLCLSIHLQPQSSSFPSLSCRGRKSVGDDGGRKKAEGDHRGLSKTACGPRATVVREERRLGQRQSWWRGDRRGFHCPKGLRLQRVASWERRKPLTWDCRDLTTARQGLPESLCCTRAPGPPGGVPGSARSEGLSGPRTLPALFLSVSLLLLCAGAPSVPKTGHPSKFFLLPLKTQRHFFI